jgi:predicted ATPase
LVATLPDAAVRIQKELTLQIALGGPLIAAKGYAAPEVARTYTRAQELCHQIGDTPQLFSVLWGLWYFYCDRAEYETARRLGEQCLTLAQKSHDATLLLEAHFVLGSTLLVLGELIAAREHYERGAAFYDPLQHRTLAFLYGQDPKVSLLSPMAWALWELGYPDQAVRKIHEAIGLAQDISHPYSLAFARGFAAWIHQLVHRRV